MLEKILTELGVLFLIVIIGLGIFVAEVMIDLFRDIDDKDL